MPLFPLTTTPLVAGGEGGTGAGARRQDKEGEPRSWVGYKHNKAKSTQTTTQFYPENLCVPLLESRIKTFPQVPNCPPKAFPKAAEEGGEMRVLVPSGFPCTRLSIQPWGCAGVKARGPPFLGGPQREMRLVQQLLVVGRSSLSSWSNTQGSL